MNKVNLIGRITKNIELRTTQSGKCVAAFSLAVNRKGRDDGTDFIPCIAWEKTAQLLEKYVGQGNKLGVCGRINTRNYEDKDKKKVYITEVIVEEVYFLESKKQDTTETENDDNFPFKEAVS